MDQSNENRTQVGLQVANGRMDNNNQENFSSLVVVVVVLLHTCSQYSYCTED